MNVVVPELGDDIKTATIACWHFQDGDTVNEGDDLVELVTAKASFNVPASSAGILKNIKYAKGQDVDIGQVIAVIE